MNGFADAINEDTHNAEKLFNELLHEAATLAGRVITVSQSVNSDGQWFVEYINFNRLPPKAGATPIEAVQNFIAYLKEGASGLEQSKPE